MTQICTLSQSFMHAYIDFNIKKLVKNTTLYATCHIGIYKQTSKKCISLDWSEFLIHTVMHTLLYLSELVI